MSDEGSGTLSQQAQQLLINLAMRVGSLEGSLKTFMENWAIQDKLAHDARRTVYERLDLIGRQVERIATDVENVQQDVAELKKEVDEEVFPSIKKHELSVERSIGAKGVWAIVIGGTVSIISVFAYGAEKLFSYFFPRP